MNDVASVNGRRIAMRVDNASEYLPAKPAMNDFNGFNFQVNLQPIFNISAGHPGSYQPFKSRIGEVASVVEAVLSTSLNAEDGNMVTLFFSFFDQATGAPEELDEVRAPALF
jgi:hypothetical protein